jgi:hypothetical protein
VHGRGRGGGLFVNAGLTFVRTRDALVARLDDDREEAMHGELRTIAARRHV